MFLLRRCVKALALIAIFVAVAAAAVSAQRVAAIGFDELTAGAAPDGFFFAPSRQATPGTWEVRGTARRHLIHAADPTVTMRGISVAGVDVAAPADVKVSTRLRLIDGDRAGGVIWRYRDASNFYFMAVVHSDRVAGLFRVTGGNRITLEITSDIDLDPEAWHAVTVVHDGDQIRATIDGIGVLRARDRTLTEGGRAGVWSAGNSTSWFDDIAIEHATK